MQTESPLLSVLVVGAGNIAGGFDAGRPVDALPLTHAGAYLRHGGFRLVGCVEPEADRRLEFATRWGVEQGFATVATAVAQLGGVDVVSICSPTASHAEHLLAVSGLRPRLIFCEKPVTNSLRSTEELLEFCDRRGIKLAVNHTRRWAPDVRRLGVELNSGHWGELRSVVAHYNKGVLNNGSHMVDLLQQLFGKLTLVATGAVRHDYPADDPSVAALLATADGIPLYMNIAHAGDYALFELVVITSTAMITMEDGGARWRIREVTDSATFSGYRVLGSDVCRDGEYSHAMLAAIGNIYDAVCAGEPLLSSGATACAAQRLCQQIRDAALGGDGVAGSAGMRSGLAP